MWSSAGPPPKEIMELLSVLLRLRGHDCRNEVRNQTEIHECFAKWLPRALVVVCNTIGNLMDPSFHKASGLPL